MRVRWMMDFVSMMYHWAHDAGDIFEERSLVRPCSLC